MAAIYKGELGTLWFSPASFLWERGSCSVLRLVAFVEITFSLYMYTVLGQSCVDYMFRRQVRG